jgi:hypothetical protein
MSLLIEHEKYHTMGPKDVKWEGEQAFPMQISRQSSGLGEQITIECPVYKDDTREDMMNRIHMCYSIIQERLESENKALLEAEGKAKKRAHDTVLRKEAKGRNEARYKREQKELRRTANKEKWDGNQLEIKLEKLEYNFLQAQKLIDESPIEAPVVDIASGNAQAPAQEQA